MLVVCRVLGDATAVCNTRVQQTADSEVGQADAGLDQTAEP